jgi:hypothetical protein
MADSNSNLCYRVVLLSESNSESAKTTSSAQEPLNPGAGDLPTSSPPPGAGTAGGPAAGATLAYVAVKVEETFSQPQAPRLSQSDETQRWSGLDQEKPYPLTDDEDSAPAVVAADIPPIVAALRRRRRRIPTWNLERYGLECLAYPFHEPQLLAWAGGGLGLGTAIGAALFLFLTSSVPETGLLLLPIFGWVPLCTVDVVCGFWNCVIASALIGEAGVVRWPGANLPRILQGLGRCLWCLIAGPMLPIAAGIYFWLNAGELTTLDWLILLELAFLAATYWLFALVAVVKNDTILAAIPSAVVRLVRELRWYSLWAAGLMCAWLLVHGLWLLDAAKELHHFVGFGWISLWLCSASAFYWMTCLLRWMGLRIFWNRGKQKNEVVLWSGQLPEASS